MRRRLSSPRTLAALGAGLGFLIACIAWFAPYLTRERETNSSVAVPPPFFVQEPIGVRPGSEACLSEVAFDTDSELIELTPLVPERPGPPLAIIAEGPGYRERAVVEGGYQPPTVLRVPIDPPDRSVVGTLCIRNAGTRLVALLGTTDARTVVARPTTSIDGEQVVPDITVRFLAAEGGSVLERAEEMVDRVAAFKPGLFGASALLWLLLLLVLVGLPAAAFYSMLSSFRGSD